MAKQGRVVVDQDKLRGRVKFAATGMTAEDLKRTRKPGAGRRRSTVWDEFVTTLAESGEVYKLGGTDDDVAAALRGMRAAMGYLFEDKTILAHPQPDGSTAIVVGTKRQRKAKETVDA